MVKIKIVFVVLTVCSSFFSFSQGDDEDKRSNKQSNSSGATSKALTDNKMGPKIFLGSISENTSVNSFVVNTVEKKLTMQGVLWDNLDATNNKYNGFISTVKIEGKNENDEISVFSSKNINSKFTGDISLSYRLRPWVVNYFLDTNKIKNFDDYSYNQLVNNADLNPRMRFMFWTLGANVSGAKYYLIDTTANFNEMVTKKGYTGWQVYGQLNLLNYNPLKKRASLHSAKLTYGEVNNIGDLDEYDIGYSNSFSNTSNSTKFSRKITGYYDTYFVQHKAVLSYEYNLYSMDTTKTRLGFVLGSDFVYKEREDNYVKFNAGFNFPIKYGAEPKEGIGDERKRIYIAAILTTTDPFDIRKTVNFDIRNTFSVSLKLATNLNIKFRK